MKQLLSFEEMKTRIVKDIVELYTDGRVAIIFFDKSFVALIPLRGWESGDEEVAIDTHELSPSELLKIGAIDQEEYDKRVKQAEESRLQTLEKRERYEFERLRKKYGAK